MALRGNTKTLYLFRLILLVALITTYLLASLSTNVSAAQITSRSLTLQAGATDGGSKAGGVVKHFFQFTLPSVGNTNVGSIKFLYCQAAAGTCNTPTGLVTTSATLGAQTGATGFTINNSTNGAPYITRTAASVTAGTAVTYRLDSVTNPNGTDCSSNNCTFYVRISTYASTDTTGGVTDSGTVAASTAEQILLTGTMPESLIFCTGGTISLNIANVPDCSSANSGNISFNQLFSPADTATATNQMAASTNADSGYAITVNGTTLTSGSNTVTAIGASATASTFGVRQFGMNLKANTTPTVGSNVNPAANGTNYKGRATGAYATADQYAFQTGDTVADSATSGAGPSDGQLYTVSYIANVSGGQPTGTYTTTLTYICTATF